MCLQVARITKERETTITGTAISRQAMVVVVDGRLHHSFDRNGSLAPLCVSFRFLPDYKMEIFKLTLLGRLC